MIKKHTFKFIAIKKCNISKKLWNAQITIKRKEREKNNNKKKTIKAYRSFNYSITSAIKKISTRRI